MKHILFSLCCIVFFGACSSENGFSKFKMDRDEALSASSLQSFKIINNKKLKGTISTIYLNDIYPNKFTKKDSFYISIFLKDNSQFKDLKFKLNNKNMINIVKLDDNNKFSKLIPTKIKWNQDYLVDFNHSISSTLSLEFILDDNITTKIFYKKKD